MDGENSDNISVLAKTVATMDCNAAYDKLIFDWNIIIITII